MKLPPEQGSPHPCAPRPGRCPREVEFDLERALWDADYRSLVKALLKRAAEEAELEAA